MATCCRTLRWSFCGDQLHRCWPKMMAMLTHGNWAKWSLTLPSSSGDDDAPRRQSVRMRTEDRDRRCVKIRKVRSFEEGNRPHISKHVLAPATACFIHAGLSIRQRQFVSGVRPWEEEELDHKVGSLCLPSLRSQAQREACWTEKFH